MNKNYPFTEVREKIEATNKIVIVLPPRPVFDQVAASLSLSLSLEKQGKSVSVYCSTPMTVEFNHLVGVNLISDKVTGSDLVISFNYLPDQIEKVSYNDDSNRPNIIIQPKVGAPQISEKLAVFSYAGIQADLVIGIGLKNQAQLEIDGQNFATSFVVNMDTDINNTVGQLSVIDNQASGLSEIVLGIISGLNLPFDQDIAQNTLSGLWKMTRGMTSQNLGADAYEAVSLCLRAGARRPNENISQPRKEEVFTPRPNVEEKPQEKKIEEVQKPKEQAKPPADWFEPKIFRGTSVS